MNILSRNDDPVWFTEFGYVSLKNGLLASSAIDVQLKTACREAELRVIYLTDRLFEEARQTVGSQSFSPETFHEGLRATRSDRHLSSQSKLVVLEYLQHKISLKDLAILEIFPFEDGVFRSLISLPVFLNRDLLDQRLFARQPESCIDADQLSDVTLTWLHQQAKANSTVGYRAPADLCDYFTTYIANGSSDSLVIDEEKRSMLSQVWEWIMRHCQKDSILSAFGPLWLVPLNNSRVRKLIPDISNSATYFDATKWKKLALEIIAIDPNNAPRLVPDDALTDVALRHLLSCAEDEPSLHLNDGRKLGGFLNFLAEGRILLQNATEDVKNSAFQAVQELYWAQKNNGLNVDIDMLKSLCIFKEIQWPIDAARSSTDLARSITFVGMRKLVPFPRRLNRIFLDATNELTCSFFQDLDLVKCLDERQILEELIVPALQNGSYETVASNLRIEAIELLFQNYYRLSSFAQGCVPSLSVVPLKKQEDDKAVSFASPVDIVDPDESALLGLYFSDELIQPEMQFYQQFRGIIASCGIIKRLNRRLVLNRIRTYEGKQLPFDVVASRAENLLKMLFYDSTSRLDNFINSVRSCVWLPAQSPEKLHTLVDSVECRDINDWPLVGRVWFTLPFQLDDSWRSILGWQNKIKVDVLISQLARSTKKLDNISVKQTLFYLGRKYDVENYMRSLLKLKFIRSSSGLFISPAEACRGGAERLSPYLYNVDVQF